VNALAECDKLESNNAGKAKRLENKVLDAETSVAAAK
jgi:hypothetical protein